jgi:hypothetical protein
MERESDPNVNQSKEKMGGKGKGEKIGQGRQGNMKMGRQRKERKEGGRYPQRKGMHGGKGGMEGWKEEIKLQIPLFFSKVLRSLIDKEAKSIGSVLLDGPSNRQQTVLFFSHF